MQMVKGDPDQRLTYLLHAERFIRANGFKKPALSRKRRTLHHCYAYMRIMAETTRSSIYYLPHGRGRADSAATDNDEFRVSRWTSLSDNMMGMEKDPDTAKRGSSPGDSGPLDLDAISRIVWHRRGIFGPAFAGNPTG